MPPVRLDIPRRRAELDGTMHRRDMIALALAGCFGARPGAAALPPRTSQWDMPGPGGEHRIMTAWPQQDPPPGGFPLLVMLDGNAGFDIALQAMRSLDKPICLCALGYPTEDGGEINRRRAMDYTPAAPGAAPDPVGLPGGGADAFLDFILTAVRPRLDALPMNWEKRALFGHSYGGLFALHHFFTRPEAFPASVAASPSLAYGDGIAWAEARRFMATPPPGAAAMRLLLTIGEKEGTAGPDASPQRLAWLEHTRRVGRAEELARVLKAMPQGPETDFVSFPGQDHGSVIPFALTRGVRFASE
jgi:predicted alpha/beta superfamily hydrolase